MSIKLIFFIILVISLTILLRFFQIKKNKIEQVKDTHKIKSVNVEKITERINLIIILTIFTIFYTFILYYIKNIQINYIDLNKYIYSQFIILLDFIGLTEWYEQNISTL